MAGNTEFVEVGVCDVEFDGSSLGYTSGGVSCSYSTESQETEVDQEDAPIEEIITKQTFEVTVPLAEHSLARFFTLLPGTSVIIDGMTFEGQYVTGGTYSSSDVVAWNGKFWRFTSGSGDGQKDAPDGTGSNWTQISSSTKQVLKLSGASGGGLNDKAGKLILKPISEGATRNDWITLYKAVPVPSISFSFEKENIRVYEVTFKGLVHDTDGLAAFGDDSATAA